MLGWLLWPALAAAELEPLDERPLGPRQAVVLLHGWNSGPACWDPLRRSILADPALQQRCRLYRWQYDWWEPLAVNAARLAVVVRARPELADRPVILVGHSMGGLVARTYLESVPGALDRVAALITCGTPHHGSPTSSLDWLGESNRLLGALPFVGGSKWLQKHLPVLSAANTVGGRQLGWDNLTVAMPAEVWKRADRTLRQLNDQLAKHPARSELLARYRFYAGFLPGVPALTDKAALSALLKGQPYPLGAAVLARSFADSQHRPVTAWLANDGIVPLESALCLQPGEPIAAWENRRVVLRPAAIARRLPWAGLPWRAWPDVDHTSTAGAPPLLADLQRDLSACDANGLVVDRSGQLWLCRPTGGEHPLGVGRLVAVDLNRLLVARPDALLARQPGAEQTLARASSETWQAAPDGAWVLAGDGLLVGCQRPAARLLGDPPTGPACWSPDRQWLVYPTAGGSQEVHLPSLTARDGPAGHRPLGFRSDGQVLWATGTAAWRGVGRLALSWVGGDGALFGGPPGTLPTPLPLPSRRPGLFLLPVGGSPLRLAEADCQPVGDGATWLAWSTSSGVATWRGQGVEAVVNVTGGPPQVAAAGALLVVLQGTAAAGYQMPAALPTPLPPLPAPVDGPSVAAADGRWLALPSGGQTWLLRTDSRQVSRLAGQPLAWLPAPVARLWDGAPH